MAIGIIDIVTCTVRAYDKAVQSMFNITLGDVPEILKRPVIREHKIKSPRGTITSVIYLTDAATSKLSGYLIVKIDRNMAKKLLEKLGLSDKITYEEIKDSCGELCNMIAGYLKTEFAAVGVKGVAISAPSIFEDEIDQDIEGLSTDYRYLMTVFCKEFGQLFTSEITFQG